MTRDRQYKASVKGHACDLMYLFRGHTVQIVDETMRRQGGSQNGWDELYDCEVDLLEELQRLIAERLNDIKL